MVDRVGTPRGLRVVKSIKWGPHKSVIALDSCFLCATASAQQIMRYFENKIKKKKKKTRTDTNEEERWLK